MIRALALLVLAACATPVGSVAGRVVTPRAKLPMPKELLPKHGIYAAGGGLTSTPWRVVVDYESSRMIAGRGTTENQSSTGPLAETWERALSSDDLGKISALGETAWSAPVPVNTSPTADYDEVVAIVDGDQAYWAEGFGRLTGPPGDLVKELREIAGNPP